MGNQFCLAMLPKFACSWLKACIILHIIWLNLLEMVRTNKVYEKQKAQTKPLKRLGWMQIPSALSDTLHTFRTAASARAGNLKACMTLIGTGLLDFSSSPGLALLPKGNRKPECILSASGAKPVAHLSNWLIWRCSLSMRWFNALAKGHDYKQRGASHSAGGA